MGPKYNLGSDYSQWYQSKHTIQSLNIIIVYLISFYASDSILMLHQWKKSPYHLSTGGGRVTKDKNSLCTEGKTKAACTKYSRGQTLTSCVHSCLNLSVSYVEYNVCRLLGSF